MAAKDKRWWPKEITFSVPLAGPMAPLAGPMWPSPPKCKMQCLGQISIHVQSFRQIRSAVSEEMCSKQTNSKLSICLLRRRDIINSVSPGDWQVAVFACHDLVAARSSAVVRRCSSRNVKTDCQITASTDQHWAASCNSTQTGNTTQYTGRPALTVSVHYHHDINQGNITSTKITDEEVSYFFLAAKTCFYFLLWTHCQITSSHATMHTLHYLQSKTEQRTTTFKTTTVNSILQIIYVKQLPMRSSTVTRKPSNATYYSESQVIQKCKQLD